MTMRNALRLPVAVVSAVTLVVALSLPAVAQGRPMNVGQPENVGPPPLVGQLTVSPETVSSGQALVDLVFTFTSGSAVLSSQPGSVQLSIPDEWQLAPHTNTAAENLSGLLQVEDVSCGHAPAIDSVTTTGNPYLVTVSFQCGDGESFKITYNDVTAPTATVDRDSVFSGDLFGPGTMALLDMAAPVTITAPVDNDADDDGVTDDLDQCANTPTTETADSRGCSPSQRDTDGDGVTDDLDQCASTPTTETADSRGCSPSQRDADGDGVTDRDDDCPATPAGRLVNGRGCPQDSDNNNGGGGGGGGGTPPETPPATPPQVGRCVDVAPNAGFRDVPVGHVHQRSIDCIAWKGITTGTSPRRFTPEGLTTRAQMASFLARALREAGVALPAARDRFHDDQRSVHHSAINQLAGAGIVAGTGAGMFEPGAPVSRGQMATMLANTYAYIRDERLSPQRDHFADDTGSVHEANIDVVADLGLTLGRTATRYEPGAATRRAQMASFLTRLLELLG